MSDQAPIEAEPGTAGTPDAGPPPEAGSGPAPLPSGRADRLTVALVAGAALIAAALRVWRLADPIAGFMGWNEGYYAHIAVLDLARPLWAPLLTPLDPSQPPLYGVLLALLARVTGGSLAGARALSIVASALIVPLTFGLARRLYNTRIALVASVATALSPGLVLVGRNVQIDAILILLEVAFVYAWVRAASEGGRWPYAAAASMALGLLAKAPFLLAVLAVLAWEVWRTGPRGLLARHVRLGAGLGLVLPAAWFGYRLLGSGAWRTAQTNFADYFEVPPLSWLWETVWLETAWMLSIVVALLALAGIVLAAVERRQADKLVLCWLLLHSATYLFFHYHTYYFLPLVPFAGMAAGRFLWRVGVRTARPAAVVAVLLTCVLSVFSLFMLVEKKHSVWGPGSIPGDLRSQGIDPRAVNVLVEEQIRGMYDQAYPFTLPGLPVVSANATSVPLPGAPRLLLSWRLQGRTPAAVTWRTDRLAVLFGYAVGSYGKSFNVFTPGGWRLARVGPPWRFGIYEERHEGWFFYDLAP